ncbi:endolytic transglycosylase MltG [Bifidobacterium indicum]|uniref:endolytic transglycosylase MltG n=1 Tax=Bifidobacterium indicum TaxID=1691 RepID=UPI0030DCE29B
MAEDIQNFFEEKVQWVEPGQAPVPAQPPRPPRSRREMRKQRQKRQRRRRMTVIIVLLALVIVATCAFFVTRSLKNGSPRISATKEVAQDYTGPGDKPIQFTVESGQGAEQVGLNLLHADVVRSSGAFVQAITNAQATDKLFPGTFDLKTKMKASDVVMILTDRSKARGFLQVRSGDRARDVITRAQQLSGLPKQDFDSILDAKGQGILPEEAQGNFEGWLEPGEYDVKSMGSAQKILSSMVTKRVRKLDELGVPQGADRQDVLIKASITEAEVNKPQYYGKVARVIDNRLARNMPLGMDSTVAYSNKVSALELTNQMLQNPDDAYNTRVHKGLPPAPIGSAGDSAIKAAMSPEEGDWIYFVTVNLDTGETRFSDNEGQFNSDVKEYKQWESDHGK